MSEKYIKLDDVMALCKKLTRGYWKEGYVERCVNELPVAVPNRPSGEWIYCEDYVGHDGYECSNCGFFIPWTYDCYADSNFILNYHTCPHCDARMKGADDENG